MLVVVACMADVWVLLCSPTVLVPWLGVVAEGAFALGLWWSGPLSEVAFFAGEGYGLPYASYCTGLSLAGKAVWLSVW